MTRAADPSTLAGIVLAGGRSRRMGRDKAALEFDGRSLLDTARQTLHATGCDRIYVSGRPDDPDGIPDARPGSGPAQAMLDCMHTIASRHAGALFLPVDMPLLEPADLAPLIDNRAICSAWTDHPLPVYISAGMAWPARDEVSSVKSLLERLAARRLDIRADRRSHFANLNTEAELTAARKKR